MSFQQAGGARSSRTGAARFSGTGARRFSPILDVGGDTTETATHVDSYEDVFSDPGATPGASTIPPHSEDRDASRRLHEDLVSRPVARSLDQCVWPCAPAA
jgi:hypothetical protein